MHLINHCAEANSESSSHTLAVFCDLSKAFDVINHDMLLRKLHNVGIRGIANDWFKSYLTNRKQYVFFKNSSSTLLPVTCGVPQGSILGPLLYLLYVNDIKNACSNSILSFADDTTLFLSDHDIDTLFASANRDINKLHEWFCANRLLLNPKKTKYIVIKPKQKSCNFIPHSLCIAGFPLQRIGSDTNEKYTQFLGIGIDDSLSWKHHIARVNQKVSRALFSIKQLKHIIPYSCLKNLYHALIQPHLSYGISLWGNANRSLLHHTIILQKRAIRTIHNAHYNSHTEPLFKKSKILKFDDLYTFSTLSFMRDYKHDDLPLSFRTMFAHNHDLPHARVTRAMINSTSCFAEQLFLLNYRFTISLGFGMTPAKYWVTPVVCLDQFSGSY